MLLLFCPMLIRPIQQVEFGCFGIEAVLQLGELLGILIEHRITKAFFHIGQLLLKLYDKLFELFNGVFVETFELFGCPGAGLAAGACRPTLSGGGST